MQGMTGKCHTPVNLHVYISACIDMFVETKSAGLHTTMEKKFKDIPPDDLNTYYIRLNFYNHFVQNIFLLAQFAHVRLPLMHSAAK